MGSNNGRPGSIEARGDLLLREAEQYDLSAVKARYERFRKAHLAWKAAQDKKAGASDAQQRALEDAGQRDAAQDVAVDALAAALPADGFPRVNPFKPFQAPVPSQLKRLGDTAQARAAIALAKKVLAHQQTKVASKAAAKALLRAAEAMLATAKKVPDAKAKAGALRKNRDELVPEWAKAWQSLKRACELVEEDGGEALHTKLFASRGGNHAPPARDAPPAAPPPAVR